jgi:hypothetical protein
MLVLDKLQLRHKHDLLTFFINYIGRIQYIVIISTSTPVLAETVLSKLLKTNFNKDIILELVLTLIFILSGWFINSWMTTIVYGTAYLGYLVLKRKEIRYSAISIKMLIKA